MRTRTASNSVSRAALAVTATATALGLLLFIGDGQAQVPGEAAPAFTGTNAYGETVSLSDFAGQTVVLEWTNHDCPYVRRHYEGNMQGLQQAAAEDDIVWIQVISSAPGEQGHVDGPTAAALNTQRSATVSHTLIDPDGIIGRAYDARTTPHMYVIDGAGVLQYAGVIDDVPRPRDGSPAPTPFVTRALEAVAEGRTPDPAATAPYGCSVKYG
jgi:hypothetical protein